MAASSLENKGYLWLNTWSRQDLYHAMGACLHENKRDPWLNSLSRHDLYDAMETCLNGNQWSFMVAFLAQLWDMMVWEIAYLENEGDLFFELQAWLVSCNGSKLAWKLERSMVEVLVEVWVIWCYGRRVAWKTREIHGWILGIDMTYNDAIAASWHEKLVRYNFMFQGYQASMENQRDIMLNF